MRSAILFLVLASLLGCSRNESASARLRYDSIGHFYSICYPPGWTVTQEKNIANIITPDGTGAITTSAFTSPNGEMEPFFANALKVFEAYEVVSPFAEWRSPSLAGRTAEYRKSEDGNTTRWIVRGVHSKRVFVLVTVNHPESDFETMRSLYTSIIDSIEIRDPKSGEPGATDNPDDAQRLREDH